MNPIDILKWSGTSLLVIGTGVNSLGYYPQGPILLVFGGLAWLTVSILWKEPALIVTNSVLALVGIGGLFINYITQ